MAYLASIYLSLSYIVYIIDLLIARFVFKKNAVRYMTRLSLKQYPAPIDKNQLDEN